MSSERAERISSDELDRFRNSLLQWFDEQGRSFPWRDEQASDYLKVIAEILLQRTTATAVSEVLPAFVERFPGWTELAKAELQEIQDMVRPLGLWRRRSKRLSRLADQMVARDGELPETRQEAELLDGIGQYIASSILLSCHDQREPLLDTNMARVLERYFGPRQKADIRHDDYLQTLSRRLVDHPEAERINWAVLDHGALVCKPQEPRCDQCPVRSGCRYWEDEVGS